MHTSRNCVTNYIHMSFTSSCLDGTCVGKPLDKFQISSALVKANSSSSFHFRATLLSLQLLYRSSSNLRLFLAPVPAGSFAPADLSSSAEHDVVTNDIIIDGPLRCSSWFSFDVPADPSSLLALAAGSYRTS
ncbi:hypothetical protein F511_23647 [Dorcoceras hygrometricum]|uniref:Uncharacterized protein n=1 Tax=Dorcoceras hygrometricum TaxID=472368 RepID=A0A2Z7CRI0_9LAMI|nr:hypothetical protein F511_23647 [Dorcoceras hygrometricum]